MHTSAMINIESRLKKAEKTKMGVVLRGQSKVAIMDLIHFHPDQNCIEVMTTSKKVVLIDLGAIDAVYMPEEEKKDG